MNEALTISALARRTGVSSKTLRYWERQGLLPAANRSHTGYRLFGPEAERYVEFVRKSKSVGLTLKEMRRVLELARRGENPCPEVMAWVREKSRGLTRQIRALEELKRHLDRVRREWSHRSAESCFGADELCCLIEGLPRMNVKGGQCHAQTVRARNRATGNGSR